MTKKTESTIDAQKIIKERLGGSNKYTLQVIGGPDKGKVFSLEFSMVTIGRWEEGESPYDITLSDKEVSGKRGHHVRIHFRTNRNIYIQDNDSKNGTSIYRKRDGKIVTIEVRQDIEPILSSNDVILLGPNTKCIIKVE